jgi:YfiH family protein
MMFTLPKPNDGFQWVQLAAGPALVCEPLHRRAPHVFTTRPWRLGTTATSSTGGREGWVEVAEAMQIQSDQLARLHQVHGTAAMTRHVGMPAPAGSCPEADIVLSDEPAVALAIQTADCVPILMCDRRQGTIAAVHAGWRGLVAHAPAAALERMAADFGSRVEDIMAAIGPAIGACCYEVGPEVRTRFEQGVFPPDALDRWFSATPLRSSRNPPMPSLPAARRRGHWFFDPAMAARDVLLSAGLSATRIFASGLCTASHPGVFCSYRRDGAPAGRMAAAIRRGGTD